MICPYTKVETCTPCQLSKCKYSIRHPEYKNCLLEYIDARDEQPLDSSEIAYLYGKTVEEIDASIAKSLAVLKQEAPGVIGVNLGRREPKPDHIRIHSSDPDKLRNIRIELIEPTFMRETNTALSVLCSQYEMVAHPAIEILTSLESILSDMQDD